MNRCAIIATHHKTGTVWMDGLFSTIAQALQIPLVNIYRDPVVAPEACKPPMIFITANSDLRKYPALPGAADTRILYLIRDPRDVVISAMHYHRIARELWLHKVRDKYQGRTYQQALNALPSDRMRYLFEMDRFSKKTVSNMLDWNYGAPGVYECRYEDLIQDTNMSLFKRIATHLGFSNAELKICRDVFWQSAIFGGRADFKGLPNHVRSGEPGQWNGVFDRALGIAFVERFGNVLTRLGYEPDDSWIARLPVTVRALGSVEIAQARAHAR